MYLGIDVGGTKIAYGLVDGKKVLSRGITPTPKNKEAFIEVLRSIARQFPRVKIGVGIPGNYYKSKMIALPNLQMLEGIDLGKELSRNVTLENDSRCFALAEAMYGAGKNKHCVLGIILGTGVGSGIVFERKLHWGSRNMAGEFGHTLLDLSTTSHQFDEIKGDWNELASGPGIIRRHLARGGTEDTPMAIWESHTELAKQTREETIRIWAIMITNLQYLLDPDVVVIGGGLTNLPILSDINKIIGNYHGVKVVQSKLGVNAGIIGATLAISQKR